eukprot:GFUD01023447.1.p1 GENE.GFUD01023447.1~~GFUD01023447.1.p1  ORF type:complete len:352 (+),score=137.57 GFUD01023447.1:47-1102(+)
MNICHLSCLPAELRLKILSFLSHHELKMVVRVSRRWREMGEDPVLWRRLRLVVSSRTQPVIEQVLRTRRLQGVRSVKFASPVAAGQAEEMIGLVGGRESVMELDITSSKLSKVQPETLGSLVRELEVVVLTNCRLTLPQLNNIFNVLSEDKPCKLQELYIGTNDLHTLPPTLLARCVNKLSILHCDNTYLLDSQVDALFLAISQENSKLKELNILSNDLSSVSPTLISTSLISLVTVNLWGTMLTSDQVDAVFTILAKDCKVTNLNLSNNDLSNILPSSLSSCISRLTRAELCHCNLVPMQATMLLTNVATQDCKLARLDLSGNPAALQQLPQQLVGTARGRLDSLELGYC